MPEPAETSEPVHDRAHAKAHAKVNLALSVGPPEPGTGMHPIASWMTAIDLADDLEITRLAPGSASELDLAWASGEPLAWEAGDDLVARAHAMLEREADRALPVRIRVRKSIPDGGGLGGGSSDAATVMRALTDMFELGFSPTHLRRLSAGLGSDIAFFIDEEHGPPRPAVVTGMGDRIERLPRFERDLVLHVPGFGCPTGAVYRAYDRNPRPLREGEVRRMSGMDSGGGEGGPEFGVLFNDLCEAAMAVQPGLAGVMSAVGDAVGATVHLSGSGSTMFTLGARSGAIPGVRSVAAVTV